MANLKFADTYNMVAFLSKPEESDGFEQIVDFLNAHVIKYALTVNLSIYTLCIEQFWSTVKAKTINEEVQLHALVDGKKRLSSLNQLMAGEIFILEYVQNVSKTTAWNEFSSTMASAIICLATNQKFNFSKYIFKTVHKELGDSLVRAATTASSLEAEQDSGGGPRCQETMGDTISQTRFENVSTQSYDPLLTRGNTLRSGEDSLKLTYMMDLCTNLQTRVLDLEQIKTTQQIEIDSLKRRVKKLKKKRSSRTYKLKRLYKVGLSGKVESSRDEESLVTLVQALAALKSVKPKVKGDVIEEPSVSVSVASALTKIGIRAIGYREHPKHPTSDIEDAFSSNFQDYFPALPRNTSSNSLNDSASLVPIVSPTLSLSHDDPYMKAYDATDNELPIPLQLLLLH
ncbi:hypothetical protein Tco_0415459 [Tanacetum coccineum]